MEKDTMMQDIENQIQNQIKNSPKGLKNLKKLKTLKEVSRKLTSKQMNFTDVQ